MCLYKVQEVPSVLGHRQSVSIPAAFIHVTQVERKRSKVTAQTYPVAAYTMNEA